MSISSPILVTGAAGRVGGVGRMVVEALRRRDLPVRALVRREDERADALRALGAEVAVGDLSRAEDVARALAGCQRLYFGMSVSAQYLEATVTAAAVAREHDDLDLSTCSLWPDSMPPIDMIASRTMSERSPEGRRQAAATLFRVMPSYSGQTTRSRMFRERLELIFIESIAGRADLRTVERSIGAVLQLTVDL